MQDSSVGQSIAQAAIWTKDATLAGVEKASEATEANPTLKNIKDTTVTYFKFLDTQVGSFFTDFVKKPES